APLDRVTGDRRAVARPDLRDDVGPVGRELGDAGDAHQAGRDGPRDQPQRARDEEGNCQEEGAPAHGLHCTRRVNRRCVISRCSMSTVPPPPPIVPPSAAPIEPGGRGWGKKILVGCGVVALAIAAACLGFILYIRAKPQVVTDFMMRQVESHYAADVTDQDKSELKEAYADFRQKLVERRISKEPMERMRTTFMTGGSKNE